jgi:hypothetical protein
LWERVYVYKDEKKSNRRWSYILNGNKKPKVPMEKLSTGGTGPVLNSEDAWRIVPSPPRVTTKSIGVGFTSEEGLLFSV